MAGKINNIQSNNIDSSHIQMFWHFDCSERMDAFQGHRVLYCPVVSKENSQCTGT